MSTARSIRVLALVLSAAVAGEARAASPVCGTPAERVGACVALRGRLTYWNGAPSARIWPVGTRRLLGVHGDVLPDDLRAVLHDFEHALYADFVVCPLTRSRPGHMQMVCIAAWRNGVVRPRPSPAP